ncbi:unnamed protein product [Urochloa humidicola]
MRAARALTRGPCYHSDSQASTTARRGSRRRPASRSDAHARPGREHGTSHPEPLAPTDPHKPRLQGTSPPRIILALSQDLPAQPQGSKPAVSTSNARLRARTASPPPGMPQNRRTRAVRRGAVSFGASGAPLPKVPLPPLLRGRRAPAAATPTPAPRRGHHHRHGARPALPATPLPPPPPPRQAPPPRIRIAPFDEPLAYTVPLHLVTGRGDVDPINERISGFYTQIAGYRKEIYDVKVTNNILNWVSFARSVADLRAEVDRVRKQASALRECVRNLGAKAFEEPAAFCEVM